MEFKKLKLEHIKSLREYFTLNQHRLCDCTIGGTFIWRDFFDTQFAVEEGILYWKVTFPHHGQAFTPPRSMDIEKTQSREVYERIISLSKTEGLAPRICVASEIVKDNLLKMFPNSKIYTDRAWSDYLYTSEDIVTLAGRKFSGQRNHMNKFKKTYSDWSFEVITNENAPHARDFIAEYAVKNPRESVVYNEGNRNAAEVLENFQLYGLFGGMLKVGSDIIGVSIGEIDGDTLYVHIEKADTAFLGSYPMLVNLFARQFVTENIIYINREEDDGAEGLRTSKLSYHPVQLLDKYIVELET